MLDYIIAEVNPKSGIMRDLHEEVLHCPCYIRCIEKGDRALLKVDLGYDYMTLHTSVVLDFFFSKDGKILTIETNNTFYILHALRSAPFPFSEELVRE